MSLLTVAAAAVVVVMAGMLFEMLRTPPGIAREIRVEHGKIFTSHRTVTAATPEEAAHLLESDWSWWRKARAEPMKDFGDGRREFVFHPLRFLGVVEGPTAFRVRLEPTESLPDGGRRIRATLAGDFDGPAEYTARPGPGGTILELAWRGAEARSVLRFAPVALVAAVHAWRERLGVEGLRDRLGSRGARR